MDEIETLLRRAAILGTSGATARKEGQEAAADGYFHDALGLAIEAVNRSADNTAHPARLEILRAAILLALDCGEVAEARRLIDEALAADTSVKFKEEWIQLRDISAWPDAWLIAAVRRDPPDVAALDALVERYWKALYGRCQLLTLNHEKAADLAQEAWCRVLRARRTLKAGGNFPGYLATVATNLWRDSHRLARRSGPLAESRLASLDMPLTTEEGRTVVLVDTLPDLNALQAEEQKLLASDIDQALERLSPLLRDIIVSRLITGESCAEIGRRYNRTEQSVSGWVRQAIREMKRHIEELNRTTAGENES